VLGAGRRDAWIVDVKAAASAQVPMQRMEFLTRLSADNPGVAADTLLGAYIEVWCQDSRTFVEDLLWGVEVLRSLDHETVPGNAVEMLRSLEVLLILAKTLGLAAVSKRCQRATAADAPEHGHRQASPSPASPPPLPGTSSGIDERRRARPRRRATRECLSCMCIFRPHGPHKCPCRQANYCSRECQVRHWRVHRQRCPFRHWRVHEAAAEEAASDVAF